MIDIHKVNSKELAELLESTTHPVIVNMPKYLIESIPSFVRHRVTFVNCGESVCDITGLPMPRFDMDDELYQAGRNKSQILKDMAAKLTADGIDTVCLDFTTQGDDDDD